ncbi:MAG: hypothetical protein AABY22_19995, partial [Nanoarchaeota archaeon]
MRSSNIIITSDFYDFVNAKHPKMDEDVFVVRIKGEAENFNKLHDNFKKIKGYYSSLFQGFVVKSRLEKYEIDYLFKGLIINPKSEKKEDAIKLEIEKIAEIKNVPVETIEKELEAGVKEELVHTETLTSLAEGKTSVSDAIKGIVLDHMKEGLQENLLYGGALSADTYHQIDDSEYTWIYNRIGIYALYKG